MAQDPDRFGIGRLFWLTSEAIVGADLATERIVLWNPAAERLFGYAADEALGMRLEVLVPEELRNRHLSGIRRYRDTGVSALVGGPAVEVPAVTREGARLDVALTLTDVTDSHAPSAVLAMIRDVTAQKCAERELEASNAVTKEFVATASHDLRTPLTTIIGFGDLLARDAPLAPDDRREAVGAMLRAARQASRLVDDLLTLSKLNAGALDVWRTSVSVAECARAACLAVGGPIDLAVDSSLRASVDPDHLERIVVNFLTNALRYGRDPVTLTANVVDGSVELRILDCGDGVPEDRESLLFRPFARATRRRDGTGLGLSIVRGLARANGGDAFYERADGRTCFGVRLPAHAEDVAS